MAEPVIDPIVTPVLVALRDCLEAWFAVASKPISRVGIRWGANYEPMIGAAPNRDEACPGIVWVRWTGTGDGSRNFPNAGGQSTPCGPGLWAVGVEIGVARCAQQWGTGPNGTGLPTQAQWDSVATTALADLATVRRAVRCCNPSDPLWPAISWGQATPMGVDGNATGVLQQLTVPVLDTAGCPPMGC